MFSFTIRQTAAYHRAVVHMRQIRALCGKSALCAENPCYMRQIRAVSGKTALCAANPRFMRQIRALSGNTTLSSSCGEEAGIEANNFFKAVA